MAEDEAQVGRVNGLAWTSVGGNCLLLKLPRADELGIEASRFEETDVHVHLPEGATPKDGPSAGLALTCTCISIYWNCDSQ
ncbi:lon protease (S16) C-terminal proteolytic domain protein [Acinetobacter baumannii 24812_8]|nr:lon protease (S16) C-terminal proteolytic domain protein [Acinetobacter baumannii 24812_8]